MTDTPIAAESGKKDDAQKPPLELVPWEAVAVLPDMYDFDIDDAENLLVFALDGIELYLAGGSLEGLMRSAQACAVYLTPPDVPVLWPAWIEVAKVLGFGARKYGKHNWRKGGALTQTRVLGAALRHLAAVRMGEELDAETGLPHVAHALCEILFAITYALEGRGDDRWCAELKAAAPDPSPTED